MGQFFAAALKQPLHRPLSCVGQFIEREIIDGQFIVKATVQMVKRVIIGLSDGNRFEELQDSVDPLSGSIVTYREVSMKRGNYRAQVADSVGPCRVLVPPGLGQSMAAISPAHCCLTVKRLRGSSHDELAQAHWPFCPVLKMILALPKPLLLLLVVIHIQKIKDTGATAEIEFHTEEEQPEGVCIGRLKDELKLLSPEHFILLDSSEYFHLDTESGDLYTAPMKLDRDTLCPDWDSDPCVITLNVFVSSGEYSEIAKVYIFIEDINDNAPYFTEEITRLSIAEDAAVGTVLTIDHLASDDDTGTNSDLTYHLSCPDNVFTLYHYADLVYLILAKALDRESQSEYKMNLIVSDRGSPPLSGSTIVVVQVTDVNDNCPIFLTSNVTVSLARNSSVNSTVAHLVAYDEDIGRNSIGEYVYSNRVQEVSKTLFRLDSTSGVIILSSPINEEKTLLHNLMVLAVGPGCTPAVATVTVSIEEVRKSEPRMEFRFIGSPKDTGVSIKEDVPLNTIIAILDILDPDRSICRPLYLNGTSPFLLKTSERNPDTYLLLTSRELDFELEQKYNLQIIGNSTTEKSSVYVEFLSVNVEDVNDNEPQFEQDHLEKSIDENNRPGEIILKVSASDADSGHNGNISYSLEDGSPNVFAIDSVSGTLRAFVSFDREIQPLYTFMVIAADHGSPSKNGSCRVIINVSDKNDNPPRFSTNEFTFFIPENLPQNGEVGIINVTDMDLGSNGEISLFLLNVTRHFSIGRDRILRSKDSFDYETEMMYDVWVEAKDNGNPPLFSRAKIHVFILDVNDNAPLILSPESNFSYVLVPPDTSKGSSITKVHAVDYDTGMNGVITYSEYGEIDPAASLFRINTVTGNITLKETTDIQHCGLYQLLVKASDQGYPEALYAIVKVNILLNYSISNRSYLESLIMDKTAVTKVNQVIMLNPCPQYKALPLISWSLSAPLALAIVAVSSLCCMAGTFLFLCSRQRKSKKKKRLDVQIPLKLNADSCAKEWDEVK
ncbi:protocadherin-20-like [Pelodytes ibericus]